MLQLCRATHLLQNRARIMLIWKRLMPPKVRAFLALGTLTALVAVATLKPLPNVSGQDKEAPQGQRTLSPLSVKDVE